MKKTKVVKIKTFLDWSVKIIIPIAAVFISVTTNTIAQTGLDRAEFVRPIIYEFTYVDKGTMYEIHYGNIIRHIPARELTIDVTTGALKSIIVFHYDGHMLHYKETFELSYNEAVRPTIVVRMPSNPSYLIYDGVFYDYMFLLMIPVEGNPALYMLCVEVDIYNGMLLNTERFDKYSLLELRLNAPISNARQRMLEAYYSLMNQLAELAMLELR